MKNAKILRNYDYITRNVLDNLYYQNYYQLIGINLSRQTNRNSSHQVNLVGKLEEYHGQLICYC